MFCLPSFVLRRIAPSVISHELEHRFSLQRLYIGDDLGDGNDIEDEVDSEA